MSAYTSLKGFDSIYVTDTFTSLQKNLISFFDWGFLNKGAFTDIKLNTMDIRLVDRSTLRRVNDPNYTDGQVWSTFHKNLVWESGIEWSHQPIVISGVYVNGTYRKPDASGYTHYVDYQNGKVIFDTALPTNSTVKMEYSYKNLNIQEAEFNTIITASQADTYSNTTFSESGIWGVLAEARAQNPCIAIECAPRVNFKPVELGNSVQWVYADVIFNVFANTPQETKKYCSFISCQNDKTIYSLDLDLMAVSGYVPLDYRGTRHSGTKNYDYLIENYRNNKIYFSNASVLGPNEIGNMFHGIVRFTMKIIGLA